MEVSEDKLAGIYMIGYHAAGEGEELKDNPHPKLSEERCLWGNGWVDWHKDNEEEFDYAEEDI